MENREKADKQDEEKERFWESSEAEISLTIRVISRYFNKT